MKKAVDIKLLPYRRPVIAMEGTTALIDTGATIPMFYFPVELLAKAFNGVDLIFDNAHVGGIGGGRVIGKIYALHNFSLGDLQYKNMQVFVPDKFYRINEAGERVFEEHPMLLSATMFEGLDYEFDTVNKRFIVNVPDGKSLDMDFKLIKNQEGQLIPVVNGVYIQEKTCVDTQNTLESYRQIAEYSLTGNLLSQEAVLSSVSNKKKSSEMSKKSFKKHDDWER